MDRFAARGAFVILLMTVGSFAGCVSFDQRSRISNASANANAPRSSASGANASDIVQSSNATNLGRMPHMHDYWRGRDHVTLMDTDVTIDPEATAADTVANVFLYHDAAIGGKVVGLPGGAIVYEGTGLMQITATWTAPTITALGVSYRSAAGSEYSELRPLANGKALDVNVTPEMTDMPHSSMTKWLFYFSPPTSGGAATGTFHLKIDIVKLRDISLFPGHPDLWNGRHDKILLDADETSTQPSPLTLLNVVTAPTADNDPGVAPKEVVPMETLGIRVTIKITSMTGVVGKVNSVFLAYHGADTQNDQDAKQVSGDFSTGVFVYQIPVAMKQTDSPYAKSSQWRFFVHVSVDPTGGALGGIGCDGCEDTQVNYHAIVTAFDHAISTNSTQS